MEDCPDCYGDGVLMEDGHYVKCPICHGTGQVTHEQAQQYWADTVDMYAAEVAYIKSQTAD